MGIRTADWIFADSTAIAIGADGDCPGKKLFAVKITETFPVFSGGAYVHGTGGFTVIENVGSVTSV
jgi:hypothetical protein